MNQCIQKQVVGYLEHLLEEKPELKTPELEAAINEAALLSLQLELDFIEKVYEMGDLEGCSKDDLKSFIKHRVNTKMGDLGYRPIVNGIDVTAIERMKWFDHLSAGKQHTDFFANRVTNYSKGTRLGCTINILKNKKWIINLVADYTQWEKGKDYPEFMDEVALSTISKGYLTTRRNT
jgi:hypothetical protein